MGLISASRSSLISPFGNSSHCPIFSRLVLFPRRVNTISNTLFFSIPFLHESGNVNIVIVLELILVAIHSETKCIHLKSCVIKNMCGPMFVQRNWGQMALLFYTMISGTRN
jgi:hypothetical protein